MVDHAGGDLAVEGEAGEDRQPRSVGRRPADGAQRVAVEVEHRAGCAGPAGADLVRVVHLIEVAVAGVDDEHVAVAARLHRVR